MKQLKYIFTAFALMFASCSKSNDITPVPEVPDEPSGTVIHAGFNDDVDTRAETTFSAEKRLFSVAFFVETPDGQLHKYLSTEPLKSQYGFEDVTMSANGMNYVGVEMHLPEHYTGTAVVAAVGNYVANGLTDRLLAVQSMDELQAMTLEAPTTGPKIRLLTYHVSTLDLQAGVPVSQKIVMKRAASRVTVPFRFALPGGGTEISMDIMMNIRGLAECVAMVYNPKSATYILPTTDANIDAIPQAKRFDQIKFDGAAQYFQYYTYEMTGNDPENMMLCVILRLRETKDSPWEEQIQMFSIENNAGTTILKRNSAYTAENKFVFEVNTDGWNDTSWIVGRPIN